MIIRIPRLLRLASSLLLFVALQLAAWGNHDLIGVYLTWERDPSTTMTVNWVNLYPDQPAKVAYRKKGEAEWRTTDGSEHILKPSILPVRRVELVDLAPDTQYEFVLGEAPKLQPFLGLKAPDEKSGDQSKKEEEASKETTKKSDAAVTEQKKQSKEQPKEQDKEQKDAKPASSSTSAPKDNRPRFLFRTMPAELTRPVRFVTGGDMMHSREMVDAMNKRAGALDPDFALLGGDLAYANGVDATRWIDWLQSWMKNSRGKSGRLIPMVIAIGNHEVKGGYKGKIPDDAPYFYGLFGLPEKRSYYALDFGKYLSLIVLDSGHTQPITGPQASWLQEALAARTEQRFVFPIYHYPAYGTAKSSASKLPAESKRSVEIQQQWIPHFEHFGVTAVFENDHHNFKRTHPIRANKRDDKTGIVYIGDGAWGVNTRTVPKNAWYLAKAEPRRHLHHVTLPPKGPVLVESIDAKGVIFDKVTFSRPRTPAATANAGQ